MQLTEYELGAHAEFLAGGSAFRLNSRPFPAGPDEVPLGRYELPRRSGEAYLYRLGHPLAAYVLGLAKSRALPPAEIVFDYTGHASQIAAVAPFVGQSGELLLSQFTVEALDQAEDHLLFAAMTDDGRLLEDDTARRLFSLTATSVKEFRNGQPHTRLQEVVAGRQEAIRRRISERNAAFFEEEAAKLDSWADDLKVALEREIKELDRQIKEARRAATAALTLEAKLEGQKLVRALEGQRNSRRRALFDAQDEIDHRREQLIAEIEGKLRQSNTSEALFWVQWRVV